MVVRRIIGRTIANFTIRRARPPHLAGRKSRALNPPFPHALCFPVPALLAVAATRSYRSYQRTRSMFRSLLLPAACLLATSAAAAARPIRLVCDVISEPTGKRLSRLVTIDPERHSV
jgi:hypothetical protein